MNTVRVLVATHNQGKVREFRRLLAPDEASETTLEFVSLSDLGVDFEVDEDGSTFEENAVKKAVEYSKHTGLLALADDSGLCVDALSGGPGIYSARYAGDEANDSDNNEKLLMELETVEDSARSAHFACALALAKGDQVVAVTHGIFKGRILRVPRGTGGFGYDPLFWLEEHGCTSAELSPDAKGEISHRGQAVRQMKSLLLEFTNK